MSEKLVVEWYNAISERERRDLITRIPGSMEYGATRSYMLLPEKAKQIVRDAFRDTLADQ